MISSLIDALLFGALAFTGWKATAMARELRRLRTGETALSKALADADASINRAAHAVVMLRSEGIDTIRALDERIAEAREVVTELEDRIRVADRRLSAANDPAAGARASGATQQDTWLSLIESRLGSGSATNR
ncbi:hypothetical protein [Aureimonas leprariae]|uniref:Uncharacterized protein n=1 Tax=Plantimonas leprariae TaxID=2615207 RepID=A0A7V7PKM7_9HYPH|nr:hypothetical protein [Aureimonas leprariae]KAB0676528.1 hypothetical protein F6X38_20795 [Aureimonas leprariae]